MTGPISSSSSSIAASYRAAGADDVKATSQSKIGQGVLPGGDRVFTGRQDAMAHFESAVQKYGGNLDELLGIAG